MSVYRSIVKHTAIYSIALVVGKMSSVLLLPVYTRYLSPADYGIMELLDLTGFILASVLGARVGDAFFYFFSRARDDSERRKVVTTSVWGAFLWGSIGAVLGYAASGLLSRLVFGTDRYTFCFQLVFLAMAVSFPAEVGSSYLRALNKSHLYVGCTMLRLVLNIAANVVLLVFFNAGIYAMLWSSLISAIVLALVLLVAGRRMIFGGFDRPLFTSIFRYALPLGISSIGMTIIHGGDRYFLKGAATLSDVGLYALAYKFGFLIAYIASAFDNQWSAQLFSVLRQPDGDKHFRRVFTYFMLVLCTAAVGISAMIRPLVGVLTRSEYHAAAELVPVIAFAYVIRAASEYMRGILAFHNRPSRNVVVTGLGVVATLTAYGLLIPPFKLWGAAIATLITFVFMAAVAWHQARRVHDYRFEWSRIFRIFAAAVIASAVSFAVKANSLAAQFATGTAAFILFLVLLWLLRVAEHDEISLARSELDSLRRSVQERVGTLAGE